MLKQADDEEGAHLERHKHDQVEQQRGQDRFRRRFCGAVEGRLAEVPHADRGQRGHHVARVRDRGVGQHALRVLAAQRGQVAPRHRDGREHAEEHEPHGAALGAFRQGNHQQDAEEPDHAHRLAGRGQQSGNGRGGTRIGIGCSEVERSGADLEAEADQHQTEGNVGQDLLTDVGPRHREGVHLQRAGPEVQQGQAVEANAGGGRSDHEVLHAALRAELRFLVERHKDVTREAGQLQPNEEHEQVLGQSHRGHPERTRQQQDVEVSLTPVVVEGREAAHLASRGGAVAVVGGERHQEQRADEQGFHQSTEGRCGEDAHAVVAHGVDQHLLRGVVPRGEQVVDEQHQRGQQGQDRNVAWKVRAAGQRIPLATKEPGQANLRAGHAEGPAAEVGHDDHQHEAKREHGLSRKVTEETGREWLHAKQTAHFRHLQTGQRKSSACTRPSCRARGRGRSRRESSPPPR